MSGREGLNVGADPVAKWHPAIGRKALPASSYQSSEPLSHIPTSSRKTSLNTSALASTGVQVLADPPSVDSTVLCSETAD